LKNIFYVLDVLLNIPTQAWLSFRKRNLDSKSAQINRINSIDKETENFIQQFSQNELIQRKGEIFNWIIEKPWISKDASYTKKYFFSSQADHFENVLLKIHQENKMVGFLWLTLRDGTAKLPYCYVGSNHEDLVAKILINQLIEHPVDTFICFQQNILPALNKNNIPFLHKKEVSKTFGWTKTLDTFFDENFYIQDGDGDGVFT